MNFKLNALVAALALVASAGANAAISGTTTAANGTSVLFVAYDASSTSTFVADLGVDMGAFLMAQGTDIFASGALAYAGSPVSANWNLSANTSTVATGNWSTQWTEFTTLAGNDYKWGVIAVDATGPTAGASATNNVRNQSLFSTANAATTNASFTALTTSGVSNVKANFDSFLAYTGNLGNHGTVDNGASVNSTNNVNGDLNRTLKGNFGQSSVGWNYLANVGETQSVVLAMQSGSKVYVLGETNSLDTLHDVADRASFTFDGTTLSYQVSAVPEASTYAMLLAGLGAVGFIARRRKSA